MSQNKKTVWLEPENESELPPLRVYNSLTNNKDSFRPINGKRVEWYGCGPTVYDVSHMGHARTYISTDILRRIMKDYLHFDVHYVMNITDIDDKIIKRARQNHLYAEYIKETKDIKAEIEQVAKHCDLWLKKEEDDSMKEIIEKERVKVNTILKDEMLMKSWKTKNDVEKDDLLFTIKDSLSSWLDEHRGHTVTDNSIFETLPRHFEELFHRDMRDLNILPPDHLTRVSEYIPQILSFTKNIIDRGYAYVSRGSVYFDTDKFHKSEGHYYAKLVPTAYGNKSLLQEGEGALSTVEVGEKRSSNDFALWKASKKGEPSWESPWGMGRPGWHIECSAMAGDKCGSHLDIHSGGVDLKFPHHDNELAQSEAHYGCAQWVNYFLHTGHLLISGCKMSKSLKNFISIEQALGSHSWRELRLAFLLSSWKDTLNYSEDLMDAAIVYEHMLLDFFFNVHVVHTRLTSDTSLSLDTGSDLDQLLTKKKAEFHEAICDSFNTHKCMGILKELVEKVNERCKCTFISSVEIRGIKDIGLYVYEMMKMFGAAEVGDSLDFVQYTEAMLTNSVQQILGVCRHFLTKLESWRDYNSGSEVKEYIATFKDSVKLRLNLNVDTYTLLKDTYRRRDVDVLLECVAQLRQSVRNFGNKSNIKKLLELCDKFRDKSLVSIGVRVQDISVSVTAIGLYPSWASEKRKIIKSEPICIFTAGLYEGLFSEYDEKGFPTHTCDGKKMSMKFRNAVKRNVNSQTSTPAAD